MNGWFLTDNIFYVSNGDLSYVHLLFYEFARQGSSSPVAPAAPSNLIVR